jgi:hypothetical protein
MLRVLKTRPLKLTRVCLFFIRAFSYHIMCSPCIDIGAWFLIQWLALLLQAFSSYASHCTDFDGRFAFWEIDILYCRGDCNEIIFNIFFKIIFFYFLKFNFNINKSKVKLRGKTLSLIETIFFFLNRWYAKINLLCFSIRES